MNNKSDVLKRLQEYYPNGRKEDGLVLVSGDNHGFHRTVRNENGNIIDLARVRNSFD